MSTRSMIGILEDNKIKAIYCHSDGYVDYNGRILFEKYNTPEKALSLVKMGQRSFLDETNPKEGLYENEEIDISEFYSADSYADAEEYNYFFNTKDNEWYCVSRWHFIDREPRKLDDLLHTKWGQDLCVKCYVEEARESVRELLSNSKRDPDWYRFEAFEDLTDISDSLLIDSGTKIARYTDGNLFATLEVCGVVKIEFGGETYFRASEFPDKLKDIFIKANEAASDGGYYAYLDSHDVSILDNNWFEIFIEDKEGNVLLTSCGDFENETPEEIKEDLKACLDEFKEQIKAVKETEEELER